MAAGHRSRRHRHPIDGGAPTRCRRQEPPRPGPRGVHRPRLGLEAALWRSHSATDEAPRRFGGLVYRGKYIVNWCPRCVTAVSDLEVVHEDTQGKIYEIRYPVIDSQDEYIVVATTRPETILG